MLSISLRIFWCKAAALHSVPNLITKASKCGINLTAARLTANKIISTQTSVTRQALCIFFSLPHFTFIFNNLCTLPGCLQTQCRKCPPCYFLRELSILQEKLVVLNIQLPPPLAVIPHSSAQKQHYYAPWFLLPYK